MARVAQRFNLSLYIMVLSAHMLGGAAVASASEMPTKGNSSAKEIEAAVPAGFADASAKGEKLEKPIRTGIAGSFLSGRFARESKDIRRAAKYLNASLAKDPANQRLRAEALRLNLLAGNVDTAIGLAKKLASDGENDALIASLMMLDAVKAGDYPKAQTWIEAAPENGLFGLIKPVISQWIAVGGGADSKSLVALQLAADKAGFFAPFITYHSALMYDMLGSPVEAEASYQKANSTSSTSTYRVVQAFANFYARNGKATEAKQVFDQYITTHPHSTIAAERYTGTTPPKALVRDAREGLAEVYYTTASLLFGEDSAQDTFLYLRIALELRPNLPPAQLMLASLYEQVGDYATAIKTYDAIAPDTVFARRAQVRKALNYEALGEKERALELLEAAAKRYPTDPTPLITKGDMLRDQKEFKEAASAYGEAIARSEPLVAGDWPLFYARGICLERSGNWPAAEADFTRALGLQPNQPDVLNYLAYSWLTTNQHVSKAQEYLEIASAARPDDPHILDSAGWAKYLAGDFKLAVEKLERAAQMMPDDVTVNDHLGDAYWRVGRRTEARFQWERALNFKPEKDTQESLRNKIANGMGAFVPVGNTVKQAKQNKSEIVPAKTQVQ